MDQSSTDSANILAHQLLQAAHNRAYRYPAEFPGFRAGLRYSTDGQIAQGSVMLSSPRDVVLELDIGEEELKGLRREIVSLIGHRWYAPYHEGDGRYTLRFGEDRVHPLGQMLIFQDDPFKSSYRIQDGSLVQINRQMGEVRFTIHIQEHTHVEGEKTLPRHFTVAYWDVAQQRLTRSDSFTDYYLAVAGYYLPVYRRIITCDNTGIRTRVIEFGDHKLLA